MLPPFNDQLGCRGSAARRNRPPSVSPTTTWRSFAKSRGIGLSGRRKSLRLSDDRSTAPTTAASCRGRSWRRVWRNSSTFFGCDLGSHISDAAGKEFALASERQEMISCLRGGGVSRQPPPARREMLIIDRRYSRRAVHALLRPGGLLFSFCTLSRGSPSSTGKPDNHVEDYALARPFRFIGGAGLQFGLRCRCARCGRFRLGGHAFGRFTLLPRLYFGLSCSHPEITGCHDCLSRIPPLGRFGACSSGISTLQLCSPRVLRGTKPVG
jgi:hypothetical protein